MKRITTLVGSLLLTCALTAPAFAAPQVSALSSRGDIYKAHVGPIGDLFPQAPKTLHTNTGIALEVKRNGEAPEWILVPTTQGSEAESTPFLLVEGRTNGVHLVWESRRNYIYSRINLASYVDGAWSDVIELSGELFSQKSAPRIVVTRDSYQEFDPETGLDITYHLTNFHTVWFEDASNGRQAVYSLVQFKNGIYQGPNHVFVLGDFDPAEGQGLAGPLEGLLEAPTVVTGRDDQHAVAAFADLSTGRLATLDFAIVPQEIVALAEKVRANITDIGNRGRGKAALAEEIVNQLYLDGSQIHPDFLNYLAQAVSVEILESEAGVSLQSLSEKVRANITDIGSRLTVLGKNDFSQPHEITTVEIPATYEGGLPSILLARIGSSRPAPEVGQGPVTLYPSPNGSDLIAAWEAANALRYVESEGDGWSAVRSLELGEDLNLSSAHQLLERRSRDR